MSTLPKEVIDAARRGWRLFPVKARGKLPLIQEWPARASSDPIVLEAWALEYPGCNWGLTTGEPSGVFVVDVDGEPGRASVTELERQGLTFPPTLSVTTGRADGGTHLYYRMPSGVDVHNDQSGRIGPNIDARATGGFVVAAGSTHASGRAYRFVNPSATIPTAPQWVIERLNSRQAMPAAMVQASLEAVTKGGRTNRLVSLAGTLHRRGMVVEAIEAALLAENAARCSPPLPEAKVRAIAQDIPARYPASEATQGSFKLIELGELLSRPDVPPDYLVDELVICGTVSCVAAKPKVGKSTFARGCSLAVARGEQFLGRNVRQGACIYLALEERYEEITSDFRAMGATGSEQIEVHADAAPASAIMALTDLVRKQRPALVVIDPLFRLAHIRDEKAYAEVYAALGPLIDLSRETNTHIMVTHHAGKSPKLDPIDSPLGSTAIGGAAATTIVLSRRESYRTIQTVTRIGPVIPETVLTFDPVTRLLSVGGTRAEADCQRIEKEIVEYLETEGGKTEPEIADEVEGRTTGKRTALRTLVERGVISRAGTGKRNDPYKYSFSCSHPISGTRERETRNDPQISANIEEKLVPENRQGLILVPGGLRV